MIAKIGVILSIPVACFIYLGLSATLGFVSYFLMDWFMIGYHCAEHLVN